MLRPGKLLLLLLVLLLSFGFYRVSDFITLKGLRWKDGSLFVEQISLKVPYAVLGFFNVKTNFRKTYINTLTVDIKIPPPTGVEEEEPLKWDFIKKIVDTSIAILEKLPVSVKVKDAYIDINRRYSINVYRFEVKKNSVKTQLVELYPNDVNPLTFEGINLTARGKKGELNFKTSYGNIDLKTFAVYNFKNLKVNLKGSVFSNGITAKGKIEINKTLKGKLEIKIPAKGFVARAKVFSPSVVEYLVPLEVFDKREKLLEAKLRIKETEIGTKGEFKLCNQYFPFTATLKGERLDFSVEDLKNLLYGVGSLYLLRRDIFLSTIDGRGGILTLKGNRKNLILSAEKFNINNLCGVVVKNLFLKGNIGKNYLHLKGFVKRLSYRDYLAFSQQGFEVSKNDFLGLKLNGSLNGLALLKDKNYWGYLFGEVSIFGKPLKVNLPLFEGSVRGKTFLFHNYIKSLSVENFALLDTEVFGNFEKNLLKVRLDKRASGLFELSINPLRFKGNLVVPLEVFNKFYVLTFKGKGNSNTGGATIRLNSYSLDLKYNRKRVKYKFLSEFVSSQGKILMEGNRLQLTSLNKVLNNPLNLTAVVPVIGDVDLKPFGVSLKSLPFCVFFGIRKLLCVQNLNLRFRDRRLTVVLRSVKNLPFSASLKLTLEGDYLDFNTLLKVKKEFLNLYLARFKTLIENPDVFVIKAHYAGNIGDFPKRFSLSFSQRVDLFSDYVYKPISIYINTLYGNGTLNGFLGFINPLNQTPFGSAEISYKPRKGFSINYDLQEFPLKIDIPKKVKGFLKVSSSGKIEIKNSTRSFEGKIGLGGYLHVLSYDFGKKESPNKGNSTEDHFHYKVRIFSTEPLFVKIPEGALGLTLNGKVSDKAKDLRVNLNYGNLNILGKKFTVVSGYVLVRDRVYLNLLLSNYAPDRTVYLKIYGYTPLQNLKFDIYSIPPMPKGELLSYLMGGAIGQAGIENFPLSKLILQKGYSEIGGLLSKLSSSFISGIDIKFVPSFDPKEGFLFGIDVEKDFSDLLSVGYHWLPSSNPKATYLWGSTRFLFNTFLRLQRYSDGSEALTIRFFKGFGNPLR